MSQDGEMTMTKRLLFELSDILRIHMECASCGTIISTPFGKWEPKALVCPGCPATLIAEQNLKALAELQDLAASVKIFCAPSEKRPFKLRLEFDDKPSES
jgi:hypothetical protein